MQSKCTRNLTLEEMLVAQLHYVAAKQKEPSDLNCDLQKVLQYELEI